MNFKSLMLARKLGGGASGGGSDADKYFEGDYEDVVLPNATKIKPYAFYQDKTLKNITMPKVTSIGNNAFNSCSNLALTSLPEGITSIESGAFRYCSNLALTELHAGITSIGSGVFNGCTKLALTELPAGIANIGTSAFFGCTALTSLTFKGKPTIISDSAFSYCTNLTTINVPWAEGEVKNAPWGATNATINYNYRDITPGLYKAGTNYSVMTESWDELTDRGAIIVDEDGHVSRGFVLPKDMPEMNEYGFYYDVMYSYYDQGLMLHADGSVDIYDASTMELIASDPAGSAIYREGEIDLSSSWLPVFQIASDGLSFFTVNSYGEIVDNYTLLNEYSPIGDLILPNDGSILGFDYEAFYYCTGLTSINIPDSVTSINVAAFSDCYSLTSITIPDSIKTIDAAAFYNCSGLTDIVIPNSVESIGYQSFYGCSRLTSIDIPDSVTSIGGYAFNNCSGLTSITIPDSVKSIGDGIFCDCSSLTNVTIPEDITSIGECMFDGCSSLDSFTIPEGVTSIDYAAFRDCSSLTSIVVPDSVTIIDDSAFYHCYGLTSITLPFVGQTKDESGNTHFGYIFGASSYYYNGSYIPSSLKTVIITGGTSIGEYAFKDCTGLTNITIPNSVISISAHAFRNCSGLTDIIVPDSVVSIGQYAFGGCTTMTSITIPFVGQTKNGSSNTHFGYIFGAQTNNYNDDWVPSSLKTVITTGGTSISEYAFSDCAGLTSVTIMDSVKSIGQRAFLNCTGLIGMTFKGTMAQWNSISKGTRWNDNVPATTVTCSDGTVDL